MARQPTRPSLADGIFTDMREQQFDSLEQAQEWLNERSRAYNEAPQADFGGLSPVQMSRLLGTDWSDFSVTRIANDLWHDDVAHSLWFRGVRALLLVTHARNGLQFPEREEDAEKENEALALEVLSVVGETTLPDAAPPPELLEAASTLLSESMALCVAGGLLRRKAGLLVTSKRSMTLTADKNAGALYREVLRTFVRDLDIVELYSVPPPFAELRHTLPFIIYRVQQEATQWRSSSWLMKRVLHPDTIDRFRGLTEMPARMRSMPVVLMVLQPLASLGLLEMKFPPSASVPEFRQTALFQRALRFVWG
ncbi:MAG: hypothetical protein ACT4P7_15560 [Gemmatimonadaceae bacterium]